MNVFTFDRSVYNGFVFKKSQILNGFVNRFRKATCLIVDFIIFATPFKFLMKL